MQPAPRTQHLLAWLLLAAVVALALRTIGLGLRPLHHDEAVNWWLAGQWAAGEFRYDPGNFHGPLLFWLLAHWRALGDPGEAMLRLPIALAGAALPLLLWPLRRALARRALLASAGLLALSPVLVWVGRYLIHETPLLLATLASVAAFAHAYARRSRAAWIAGCVAVALAFALKETAIVVVASLAFAAVLAWPRSPRAWWRTLVAREWLGARTWLAGVALALAVLALLYSGGGRHPEGVLDLARSLALWTRTGVEGAGHAKPWSYHLLLLARYEAPLIVLALCAWPLLRRREPWPLFLAAWFASTLLAYSITPYKTPWLVANAVLPLCLLAGVGAAQAIAWRPRAGGALLVLACVASAALALRLNLLHATDAGEPIVYMQHGERVRDLARDIAAHVAAAPPGAREVVIASEESWPLPYYLRNVPGVGYPTGPQAAPGADIAVLAIDSRLPPLALDPLQWRSEPYAVRPNQDYVVWFRRR